MSLKTDSEMSTKVQEDDGADQGFESGTISEHLHSSEYSLVDSKGKPTSDNNTKSSDTNCTQLDSGLDLTISDNKDKPTKTTDTDCTQLDSGVVLTISEDLSNYEFSDKSITEKDASPPLINITDERDEDIPPLVILFQQDEDGDTQLHIAAVHGCQKSIRTLVRVCPDRAWLDVPNDFGHTALHLAVLSGHAVVARMLVLAGASVSIRDLAGENPLHLASAAGNIECITALLNPPNDQKRLQKRNAILNQKNYKGQTSVHLAAMGGHVEALQTLVYYGADINAREGLCGWTALHVVAARDDQAAVSYLARRCAGVSVRARDFAGRTPRRLARAGGAARAVLDAARDPLHSDSEGDDESDDEASTDSDLFEEVMSLKVMTSVA